MAVCKPIQRSVGAGTRLLAAIVTGGNARLRGVRGRAWGGGEGHGGLR